VDSSNEPSAFCTLINSYNFFTVNCKFSLIQPVFVCSNSDFFFYSTFYRFVCFLSHKVKEKYRIIIKLCWWSTFLCAIESCFYQCNKQLFLFSTQTRVVFQKTIANSTASSQTSWPTNTLIFCFLYFRCKSCYSRNTKKNVPRNRESNPPLVFHFSGRCSHTAVQTRAPPTRFCFNTIQWQMVSSKSRFRSNREFVVHQIPRLGFAF
jgi:hypothetical protein